MLSLKRDLLHARWHAQHQADSLLHRGRESGIRYQGEADGLLMAIRMIAAAERAPVGVGVVRANDKETT